MITPYAQATTLAAAGAQGRKVVANLPYNLTKSILRRLLPLGDHITHLYLMLQVPCSP